MLCGVDTLHAWLAFPFGMLNNQGVYITVDGGTSWSRQACFNNTDSRARLVHFFNVNQGVAVGDPLGYFEIYTSGNMGISWQRVATANIPLPLPTELVVDNSLDVAGETLRFGTTMGRVFKSTDKGYHWTATSTQLSSAVKPYFRNELTGLLVDKSQPNNPVLYRTNDGGISWESVNPLGPFLGNDLCYVPNTAGSWVSTGYASGYAGASYSLDDGTTWQRFAGTDSIPFYEVEFCSNHFGLAGGTTLNDSTRGAFRYTDTLQASLEPPQDLTITPIGTDAVLDWLPPIGNIGNLVAYAIYREGLFIASVAPTLLTFTDNGLSNGYYHYCIKAIYSYGVSIKECAAISFTVGVDATPPDNSVDAVPNPFTDEIIIRSVGKIDEVKLLSVAGQCIINLRPDMYSVRLSLSHLPSGVYILQSKSNKKVFINKVIKL